MVAKKTNDYGPAGDLYSVPETIMPSDSSLSFIKQYFPLLDLHSLYTDLNYQINKAKKNNFEIELKKELSSMVRLSKKIIRRKFRHEEMRNAFFFFEDSGVDISKEETFNKENVDLKKMIQQVAGSVGMGRPQDYVLRAVIEEVNIHLKYYHQTALKKHVTDSGYACSTNERFCGNGITLVSLLLKDFNISFQSNKTIFSLVKSL